MLPTVVHGCKRTPPALVPGPAHVGAAVSPWDVRLRSLLDATDVRPVPRFVVHPPSSASPGGPPLRGLLVGFLLLVALDAVARLTYWGRHHVSDGWIGWFDASAEGSVPALFAVATMAAVGLTAWWRADSATSKRCWRCFGTLFLYLAVDDLFGLHERFGALLHPSLGGHGVYVWTFTLAPALALFGAVCGWRLWRQMPDERQRRRLVAGFVALGCALLCEVAEDRAIASGLQLRGVPLVAYTSWIEESLELLGPLCLLAAVWAGAPSVQRQARHEGEAVSVRFLGAGR